MSPTQRTLKKLRTEGWCCAMTEKWNPHVGCRQDLFGFIDVLAIKDDRVMAVQTTTASHAENRVQKILGLDSAKLWLAGAHRTIVVHSWAKRGPRGKRKQWQCREIPVIIGCGSVYSAQCLHSLFGAINEKQLGCSPVLPPFSDSERGG